VTHDGVVLVGDGFWERPPSPAPLEPVGAFPEEYGDLARTVERVQAPGWVLLDLYA